MTCERSAAWLEGYEAYEAGDDVWQNAYAEGVEAEDWREGWMKAAEDCVRDAEMNDMDQVLDDPRRKCL